MTKRNIQRHEASRGPSAIVEYLVQSMSLSVSSCLLVGIHIHVNLILAAIVAVIVFVNDK